MKKGYLLICLAFVLGVTLTWGILRASAMQNTLSIESASQERAQTQFAPANDPKSAGNNLYVRYDPSQCPGEINIKPSPRNTKFNGDNCSLTPDQFVPPQVDSPDNQREIIWSTDSQHQKGTNLHNPGSDSLDVYVVNPDGQPAAYVWVFAYRGYSYYGYAQTDTNGHAYLTLDSGVYFLTAESEIDSFFLYQKDVTVPGSTTMSAVGSKEVALTAMKRDGSPFTYGQIHIGVSNEDYSIQGSLGVGVDGTRTFHVLAGYYDILVMSWSEYYVLYKVDQDYTTGGIANFDMSTQPSAEIIYNHPYDELANIVIYPDDSNLFGFGWQDEPSGRHLIVSANIGYLARQELVYQDLSGTYWEEVFSSNPSYFSLEPGEVFDFYVGGTLSVQGRTADATPGDWITLTTTPEDSFGNMLSWIYTSTDHSYWWYVEPKILITDPNGTVAQSDSTWYYLPAYSPAGLYQIHYELDTGPNQGVITTDSQFNVQSVDGLLVYVENADGEPAYPAWVYAIDQDRNSGSAQTGPDGYAVLNIPPGTYEVSVESWIEQFYIYELDVAAPGSISLSAVGTPEVTLTAKQLDGSPMYDATVLVQPVGVILFNGGVGYVGADGQLVFHVTPGVYNIDVLDWSNYYLYDLDQDLTAPSNSLNFDMSIRPSAELLIAHPDDATSRTIISRPWGLGHVGFYFDDVADNTVVTLMADREYYFQQGITRVGSNSVYWNYTFYYDYYNDTYFGPGDSKTFGVGGFLSTSGRTQEAYIGDVITLTNDIRDSYGSYLTDIYTRTPDYQSGYIYPIFEISDPEGSVTYWNWWSYYIPTDSPTGLYDMHFEWDTGDPYQGLLTADSQFEVKAQQTSAVIPTGGGTLYSPWDDTLYEFAPGTFSGDVIITHTVMYTEIPPYLPWVGIGHFYDVTAVYSDTGLPAEPTQPYTITIGYDEWQRGGAIELSLGLYNWDGAQWVLEPTSVVDPDMNQLVAHPNHFSTWGILGDTIRFFMPLTVRP